MPDEIRVITAPYFVTTLPFCVAFSSHSSVSTLSLSVSLSQSLCPRLSLYYVTTTPLSQQTLRASIATDRQCCLLSPLGLARRRAEKIGPCAQRDGRSQTLRGSYVTPILYKRFKASANLHGSGEVAKGASQAAYVP